MAPRLKDYKPIEFRQLCMVVKMLLQQAPEIDDAEWKARTRDHLQRLGFDEPSSDMLSRSMTQVEQALRKTVGPRVDRSVPVPPVDLKPKPIAPPESVRTNKPMGWDLVVSMMRNLRKVSPAFESTSPQKAPRREVLGITEHVALDEFWRQIHAGADKLALLRAFAEVALVRPAEWKPAEIRADFERLRFGQDQCFVCNFAEVQHHHIIQIQHGGSNNRRNFAALCERCHGAVHPWLDVHPTKARGFVRIGEIKARPVPGEGQREVS